MRKKNVELGEKKKKKNPNCLTTSNFSKRSVSQYIANNFSTLSCKTNEKTRSNEKKEHWVVERILFKHKTCECQAFAPVDG